MCRLDARRGFHAGRSRHLRPAVVEEPFTRKVRRVRVAVAGGGADVDDGRAQGVDLRGGEARRDGRGMDLGLVEHLVGDPVADLEWFLDGRREAAIGIAV